MRSFKVLVIVACLGFGLALLIPGRASGSDRAADAAEAAQLLTLINAYRASEGVPSLVADPLLTRVAEWEVNDMVANGYTGHTDSQGRALLTRFASFNIIRGWMGENVASGYASASAVLSAFQHSPGHNANLLRPVFTRLGIARLVDPHHYQQIRWAVTFGDEETHDTR